MIPPIETLRTMSGAAVLLTLRDALFDEADRIGGLENTLIEVGHITRWDEGRASAHHALAAAGEVVERLRAMGEEAKAKGAKPNSLVLLVADIARSALIFERTKTERAAEPPPSEVADAAAAD